MPVKLLIAFLFSFISVLSYSQSSTSDVVTDKNGDTLGLKSSFIENCVIGAKTEVVEMSGYKLKTRSYCKCVIEKFIPFVTMKQLNEAMAKGPEGFVQLMVDEGYIEDVLTCSNQDAELDKTAEVNIEYTSDIAIKYNEDMFTKEVMKEFQVSEPEARKYAKCVMSKMNGNGYTWNDLDDANSEESKVYNEILIQCMNDVFPTEEQTGTSKVSGSPSYIKVPLIKYGTSYKVKLNIGGIEKYFLLDTGSSDIVISNEFADKLFNNGTITVSDIVGKETYSMANNENIEATVFSIDNIIIGSYKIDDVIVSAIDNGSLLLGMSFLNSFSNWKIEGDYLILYK